MFEENIKKENSFRRKLAIGAFPMVGIAHPHMQGWVLEAQKKVVA